MLYSNSNVPFPQEKGKVVIGARAFIRFAAEKIIPFIGQGVMSSGGATRRIG